MRERTAFSVPSPAILGARRRFAAAQRKVGEG